jgi:opacity protein-like surface antigen
MGDINNTDPLYYKNMGGGVFVKYNFNPTWGVRASFNYLPITGSDYDFENDYQQDRGLLFNNNLKEFSLIGEFNFFRFIAGRQANKQTPYLMAGAAVIHHNPYAYYNDEKIYFRDHPLEINSNGENVTYSTWAISIPIGLGYKYNIKGPWSIGAEINYRTVLSDHIDAVSQYYRMDANLPEPWLTIADPTGQLATRGGTRRGDGKNLDGYMTAGLTLTYTLISRKCNWWQ